MTVKGAGLGGCCCGPCHGPPNDQRASTSEIQPIQQYCCRCVPVRACVTINDGEYGEYSKFLDPACDLNEFEGAPILFRGTVEVRGTSDTINIRYEVIYEECYLTWDLETLGLSGSLLITDDPAGYPSGCNEQQRSSCCTFGGFWEVPEDGYGEAFTLTISEPPLAPIKGEVECGGCKCVCDCACFSVYTRTSDFFTYTGTSVQVCSELVQDPQTNCDGGVVYYPPWKEWTHTNWDVRIKSQRNWPVLSAGVNVGTEVSYSCLIGALLWRGDGVVHTVNGAADVEFGFNTTGREALQFKWVGRAHNDDATLIFYAWNWTTSSWDQITTVAGRAAGVTVNRAVIGSLEPAHTGTGGDLGDVSLRIVAQDGTQLITDMLYVVAEDCCELELVPPDGVTPVAWLQGSSLKVPMTFPNDCPDPSAVWEFTDYDGTDYLIVWECHWCGDTCGSIFTACCNRPLPQVLVATVDLACYGICGTEVSIVLNAGSTGAIWDGTASECGEGWSATLSCTGDVDDPVWEFKLLQGPGSCSFTGTAAANNQQCSPLELRFAGDFDMGIGCCGGTESPFITSVAISVEITE